MFDDVVVLFPSAEMFRGKLLVDPFKDMVDAPVEAVEVEVCVKLGLKRSAIIPAPMAPTMRK